MYSHAGDRKTFHDDPLMLLTLCYNHFSDISYRKFQRKKATPDRYGIGSQILNVTLGI